jgi:hypothetical protein
LTGRQGLFTGAVYSTVPDCKHVPLAQAKRIPVSKDSVTFPFIAIPDERRTTRNIFHQFLKLATSIGRIIPDLVWLTKQFDKLRFQHATLNLAYSFPNLTIPLAPGINGIGIESFQVARFPISG